MKKLLLLLLCVPLIGSGQSESHINYIKENNRLIDELARVYFDLGMHNYSEGLNNTLYPPNPEDDPPNLILAEKYYKLAIDYFTESIKLNPNSPYAYSWRASCHYGLVFKKSPGFKEIGWKPPSPRPMTIKEKKLYNLACNDLTESIKLLEILNNDNFTLSDDYAMRAYCKYDLGLSYCSDLKKACEIGYNSHNNPCSYLDSNYRLEHKKWEDCIE